MYLYWTKSFERNDPRNVLETREFDKYETSKSRGTFRNLETLKTHPTFEKLFPLKKAPNFRKEFLETLAMGNWFASCVVTHLLPSHLLPSHLFPSHLLSSHLLPSHLLQSHLLPSHLLTSCMGCTVSLECSTPPTPCRHAGM